MRRASWPEVAGTWKSALGGFVLFLVLGAIYGYLDYRSGITERDVPRLMAEAAGQVPIAEPDNEGAKALRDLFREAIAMQKEVGEFRRRYDTPEMANLQQAQSVSSRQQIEETLKQLREQRDFSVQIAKAPALLMEHFRASGKRLSSNRYVSFLEGVQEGFEKRAAENIAANEKELQYIQAEIEIYEFALRHFAAFSVRGDQIYIAGPELLEQYKAKVARAREMAIEYTRVSEAAAAKQKAAMDKMHLSQSDVGAL